MTGTESDLLQSLGMGAEPEIALRIGEGGVNLVAEAPFAVGGRHAVVKGTQTGNLPIVTGKTTAVRVNPKGTTDVFVGVERWTRAVSRGGFNHHLFGTPPIERRIVMQQTSRDVLIEPYLVGGIHVCIKKFG